MKTLFGATVLAIIGLWVVALLSLGADSDWRLSLIANFRLQMLMGFVVVTAVMAALRKYFWLSIGLAGLVLSLTWVGPWLGTGTPGEPSGDSIRLLHLNVLASNQDTAAVAELMRASDADIVFLAEATPDWRRRLRDTDIAYELVATPGDFRFGILGYTRRDVEAEVVAEVRGVSGFRLPTPMLEMTLGGEPLTVVSFHTSSPVSIARNEARDDQLSSLAELMASIEGHAVLLGDLNATPWTPGMSELEENGYVNSLRSAGLQPSWRAGSGPFMIPIDHVFHDSGLEVIRRETVASSGSDHLGVLIELQLDASG